MFIETSVTSYTHLGFLLFFVGVLCYIYKVSNCAPGVTKLFLYPYEGEFMHGLFKKNLEKLAQSFTFAFRYINDVLSLIIKKIGDFVDRIYRIDLEMNNPDTARSDSYIDLYLEIDNESELRTKLFDKRYFKFPIVNFPFISHSTFQQHMDMTYISFSRCDIPQLIITFSISLIESCCKQAS